jgi:hypothetical protein
MIVIWESKILTGKVFASCQQGMHYARYSRTDCSLCSDFIKNSNQNYKLINHCLSETHATQIIITALSGLLC